MMNYGIGNDKEMGVRYGAHRVMVVITLLSEKSGELESNASKYPEYSFK